MNIKKNFISHQKSRSINNKLSIKQLDINNNLLNGQPKNNCFINNNNNNNRVNENYNINKSEETIDTNNLVKTIDEMKQNVLNLYYDKNSSFKKKIDALNLKFYLETEKYLKKSKINDYILNQKLQANLFIILFQQINILIEEIERLNKIILDNKFKKENIVQRTNDLYEKKQNILLKDNLIQSLKKTNTNTEKKLLETLLHEDKLIKDNERLRKENETYRTLTIVFEKELKNKIKHDLTPQKNKIIRHIKTYSDYGIPSISVINELGNSNTTGNYEEKYETLDNGKQSTTREDNKNLYNSKKVNKEIYNTNQNKNNIKINKKLKNKEDNKNIKYKQIPKNPILTENNSNKDKKNEIKYFSNYNKQKLKQSHDKKINNNMNLTNKKNNNIFFSNNKNTLNSYKNKKLNVIKKNKGINLDNISNNINYVTNTNQNAITETNNLSFEKIKDKNFQKIEIKKGCYHKKQKTMSEVSFNEIVKVHILNDELNNTINDKDNKDINNKVNNKKNDEKNNNLKKNNQYKNNFKNNIKKNF